MHQCLCVCCLMVTTVVFYNYFQVKQMLIALLCESEMRLTDDTIETILDKV